MKKFPTPITAENFNSAVSYISRASAKSKKKKLIKMFAFPIGSILFTLLSILLAYGAFYMYSDPEEMIIFEKFDFVTELWTSFSETFTNAEMLWYVFWPILICVAFIIPLAVSAIIAIIISICARTKQQQLPEGTEADKAKKLNSMAIDLSKATSNYDSYALITLFKLLFITSITALLIYAFFVMKMEFTISMILGIIVTVLVGYFVYSIIFEFFNNLNRLFYKNKDVYGITNETDKYWLKVDPEEKKRREEEAEAARLLAEKNRAIAEEKRILALAAEKNGRYSTAKQLFKEAAEMGDALGMDNYARHCLIDGNRSEAIRWLQKAVDTGETDEATKTLLRALKDGQSINATYCG